ncbi:MAG: 7-carboxy-7-deazaguanine synthase QueE [Candidatus Omnitrophota bacterium]
MKGKIAEIFESVQGEGLYFGHKQLFIRFFGCNLNCKFCDTKPINYVEYEVEELFEKIKSNNNQLRFVSFTGGEPLVQKDFLKNVSKLTKENGFMNYLDSNGIMAEELKEVIEFIDVIAMDLKLPSSTGMDGFWQEHRRFLQVASEKEVFLKTVICENTSDEDFKKAVDLIKDTCSSAVLVLQPDSSKLSDFLEEKLQEFNQICYEEGIVSCIIPQMHKIIGIK